MQHQIVVHLGSQHEHECIYGVPHEFDVDEVRQTIDNLMQAEGQGSLVLDTGDNEFAFIPTRSIVYVTIEKAEDSNGSE